MPPEPLSEAAIADALPTLEGWTRVGDGIERRFAFGSFGVAFGFMAAVALRAEKMNHHPEWSNVYDRVEVRLTTHDAPGLSQLDVDLARHMNELASRFTA